MVLQIRKAESWIMKVLDQKVLQTTPKALLDVLHYFLYEPASNDLVRQSGLGVPAPHGAPGVSSSHADADAARALHCREFQQDRFDDGMYEYCYTYCFTTFCSVRFCS